MDCTFYNNKNCKILTTKCQNPDKCRFFITSEQFSASVSNSHKKLQSLPKIKQLYVADKYYAGKQVWNNIVTLSLGAD